MIPKHKNAEEIWFEGDDGWWASLKPGLCTEPWLHTVHADETLSKRAGLEDLMEKLNEAGPCSCPECSAKVR